METQKYFAELLGTFVLTLAVSLSLIIYPFPLPTPVVAGLTLGLFVYTIGHISGAHLNPAVTIALTAAKKLRVKEAVLYIIAQLLGGAIAFHVAGNATGYTPDVEIYETMSVGFGETLGAFILVFGILAVVDKKVPSEMSGLVVGGSLLLGIMLASGSSNGILNPAVAFGVGSFSVMYVFAPIIGGVLAAIGYNALNKKEI